MIDISGAIEPQFYSELLKGLGLNNVPDRDDRSSWRALRELFTKKFLERSQSEWEAEFDGTDSCVTPVIPLTPEDNRPIAHLSNSPGLDVRDPKLGMLMAGIGMKDVMSEWMGWVLGKDYTVDTHGTVSIASFARL
jgi:alpha-methylacyl-CoA racemase